MVVQPASKAQTEQWVQEGHISPAQAALLRGESARGPATWASDAGWAVGTIVLCALAPIPFVLRDEVPTSTGAIQRLLGVMLGIAFLLLCAGLVSRRLLGRRSELFFVAAATFLLDACWYNPIPRGWTAVLALVAIAASLALRLRLETRWALLVLGVVGTFLFLPLGVPGASFNAEALVALAFLLGTWAALPDGERTSLAFIGLLAAGIVAVAALASLLAGPTWNRAGLALAAALLGGLFVALMRLPTARAVRLPNLALDGLPQIGR